MSTSERDFDWGTAERTDKLAAIEALRAKGLGVFKYVDAASSLDDINFELWLLRERETRSLIERATQRAAAEQRALQGLSKRGEGLRPPHPF